MNRLSFGILVISFVFLMIPSTFVGIVELTGLNIFTIMGPFYFIGLLMAGVGNSVVYVTLHAELKRAAIQFLKYRSFTKETSVIQIVTTTNSTH